MPDRINHTIDFGVLEDVLETLRFRSSVFFSSELAAPWGIELQPLDSPRFHIAMAGSFFVGVDEQQVQANECDIVMIPQGHAHWIADQPDRELVCDSRASDACELGNPLFQEGEITNRLICGLAKFDDGLSHPFLQSVPEIIHFPKIGKDPRISMTVRLIDAEIRRADTHQGAIIDRLMEVLFLQLMDHYVTHNDEVTGFFSALQDKRVGKALTLMHQRPDLDWSLANLGEQVGMSKATLVRRFQEALGVAPMTYLAQWRLTKAANMVRHTTITLDQIADSVGFATAKTLSKAYARQFDCTPSETRRLARAK